MQIFLKNPHIAVSKYVFFCEVFEDTSCLLFSKIPFIDFSSSINSLNNLNHSWAPTFACSPIIPVSLSSPPVFPDSQSYIQLAIGISTWIIKRHPKPFRFLKGWTTCYGLNVSLIQTSCVGNLIQTQELTVSGGWALRR